MYSDIELRETQFINIGFGLADSNPEFGERRVSKRASSIRKSTNVPM